MFRIRINLRNCLYFRHISRNPCESIDPRMGSTYTGNSGHVIMPRAGFEPTSVMFERSNTGGAVDFEATDPRHFKIILN
jgi:hypothetical protein